MHAECMIKHHALSQILMVRSPHLKYFDRQASMIMDASSIQGVHVLTVDYMSPCMYCLLVGHGALLATGGELSGEHPGQRWLDSSPRSHQQQPHGHSRAPVAARSRQQCQRQRWDQVCIYMHIGDAICGF